MFEFLGAHPEIYPCAVKEPKYFARDGEGYESGEAEYLELFAGARDEKWLLEASPYYLVSSHAAPRIRDVSPEARFVVMLRNPLEMVQSYHRLLVRDGRESLADLATAIRREDPVDGTASLSDGVRYKRWARYGEQLDRLLAIFPREQVHVVVYDDFARDVPGAYRDVLEFLGVDPGFAPRFRVVAATAVVRSQAVERMLRKRSGLGRRLVRTTVPRRYRAAARGTLDRINSRPVRLEPLVAALRVELWKDLEQDVTLLSKVVDRDFVSLWRPS